MDASTFEALKSGATLLTAGQRLAQHLQGEYDARMVAQGVTVWPSPDILTWKAWIERLWEQSLGLVSTDSAVSGRSLLSPAQELKLWEGIIRRSPWNNALLQVYATARLAREAWLLSWAWRLPQVHAMNEDARAFGEWAQEFDTLCRRRAWQDRARLPDEIAAAFESGDLPAPASLWLAGFDELTPQQQHLFQILDGRGTSATHLESAAPLARAQRLACQSAEEEISLAARWARRQLESGPTGRLGIVVPDLAAQRAAVLRIFDDVLMPAAVLPAAHAPVRAYNLSLGRALSEYPVIHTALQVLEFGTGELGYEQAGSLLRAPFLAGAETELSRRALLDVRLRRLGETRVTIRLLRRLAQELDADQVARAHAAPLLAQSLKVWHDAVQALPRRQLPSAWAESFARLLQLSGWPGERPLDSEEYQTVEAWRDLYSTLSSLDAVVGETDYREALTTLRRLAAERVFEPQTPAVPIQILGTLEAAGLSFDALWVMGLHDGIWPASPRPNPFLPLELQRARGLPHASAERELGFARLLTQRLLAAAPQVIVSYPLRNGNEDLRPSPLIVALPPIDLASLALPDGVSLAQAIHAAQQIEELDDSRAPALAAGVYVPRGTSVFRDQAACPFRAFAHVRLAARALDEPEPGLDALARGSLLHEVMHAVWQELKSQANLTGHTDESLHELVRATVRHALHTAAEKRRATFTERFLALEEWRLTALVRAWLAVEKQRAPFTVVMTEQKDRPSFGGIAIDSVVDRVDTLEDGERVFIDYKTGNAELRQWFGDRPDEPQLPLYSAASDVPVAAVLFARLRTKALDFTGVARRAGIVPEVPAFSATREAAALATAQPWEALFAQWRRVLEALGESFRLGDAHVDPKDGPRTCEYCDLKSLCRIHERTANTLVESGENGA
jgi:probable DNA repair protein